MPLLHALSISLQKIHFSCVHCLHCLCNFAFARGGKGWKKHLGFTTFFIFTQYLIFFFRFLKKKKIRQWTDLSDTFVGRFSLFLFFFLLCCLMHFCSSVHFKVVSVKVKQAIIRLLWGGERRLQSSLYPLLSPSETASHTKSDITSTGASHSLVLFRLVGLSFYFCIWA